MHQEAIRGRWVRLVAYGLIVLAAGLLGWSINGFMQRAQVQQGVNQPLDMPLSEDVEGLPEGFDALEPTPALLKDEATTQQETVVVYISGAVVQPDTYELPANARVSDVVQLAGGLTDEADRDRINLSERIQDAQHIHIVRAGESAPTGEERGAASGLIDLNTATAQELEALPRIGAALAERIVEWRTANGPFAASEEIQQVKGISASVYDEIKDKITVTR